MGGETRPSVARPGEQVVDVRCEVRGKGEFDVVVVPAWAPLGAERFLAMVEDGFFDGIALFRAVPNFLVQFGIAEDPELNRKWAEQTMADDPKVDVRIGRGTLAFAGSGPNSRSAQMFVSLSDKNWPHLGKEPWETPFAYVPLDDFERVWTQVNTEYGDMKPWGERGVEVGRIWQEGYHYLTANFPNMDYIEFCRVIETREVGVTQSPTPPHMIPTDNLQTLRSQDSPVAEGTCTWCSTAAAGIALSVVLGCAWRVLSGRRKGSKGQ